MSSVLHLGHPANAVAGSKALIALHAEQGFTSMLFAQGGQLGGLVAQGGHPLNKLPRSGWPGHYAIQRGERPPCAGIDMVRAIIADAAMMAEPPAVIVWGPLFAFVEGKRVRRWDASQDEIVSTVLLYGLDGWGWAAGRLVRLKG